MNAPPFWQLTVDANDPDRLARFWAAALGYTSTPPPTPQPWWDHYRAALGDEDAFTNRLFPPDSAGPALWFQPVPERKAGKNRLHLDLYPTARDDTLTQSRRIEIVEATVGRLVGLGARILQRTRDDEDPADLVYYVTMADPEGNEFCVS